MRADDNVVFGTVIENHGAIFEVSLDDRDGLPNAGHVIHCGLRGKLKLVKKGARRIAATPVAAGDRVKVTLLAPGRGVIEEALPRETGLSRTAAGSRPLRQTLVANVDQAVIVFAAAEPRADLYLLDRFLAATVASELAPLVCINKCDLVDGEPLRARLAVYRQYDFRVLFTSAATGEGVEGLRKALKDRRSVLCGPSGVGKSSLLNAVAPGLLLRTGEVGAVTHKGRHTTTSISFQELPFGGWVADTAGLRQFGFWEITGEALRPAFPELQPYLGRCRFSNCTHQREEGCALREAVAVGAVEERRLQSFQEMGGR